MKNRPAVAAAPKTPAESYLGFLYALEEVAVYGYVTPLKLKIVLALVLIPSVRRQWRWRIPAFRESAFAQTASALALMLKNGVPFDDALHLMQQVEQGTRAGNEFARWRQRLAALAYFPSGRDSSDFKGDRTRNREPP